MTRFRANKSSYRSVEDAGLDQTIPVVLKAMAAATTKHKGRATTALLHQCLKLLIDQLWTWIRPFRSPNLEHGKSSSFSSNSKRLSKCYHKSQRCYSSIMLILIWILTTITVCTSSQSWVVHPSTWKYFQQVM